MAKTKSHPGTFEDIGDYRRLTLWVGGKRFRFRVETKDRKACEKFAREKHRELTARLDRSRQRVLRQRGRSERAADPR